MPHRIIAGLFLAAALGAHAQDKKLDDIRAAIQGKKAGWVAAETSISRLSVEKTPGRLGLFFGPIKAPPLTDIALSVGPLPRRLDWREKHAVSGIRDQGQCGSCWAFAMTQALESSLMIAAGDGKDVSLAEQVLVSCSGAGTCNGGMLNADFLVSTGIPPVSYFPYSGSDASCDAARSGWRDHTYRIGSWNSVPADLASLKAALVANGPLPTSFVVMDDFRFYQSGVYSYTTGQSLGGHAVLLVGYDDDGEYFIAKNSWGTGWGEDGFFRIAYGAMKDPVDFATRGTIAYTAAADARNVVSLRPVTPTVPEALAAGDFAAALKLAQAKQPADDALVSACRYFVKGGEAAAQRDFGAARVAFRRAEAAPAVKEQAQRWTCRMYEREGIPRQAVTCLQQAGLAAK